MNKPKLCPHDGHDCEVLDLEDRIEALEEELRLLRVPPARQQLYVEAATQDSVAVGSKVKFVLDPTDPLRRKSIVVLAGDADYQGVVTSCPSVNYPYCGVLLMDGTGSLPAFDLQEDLVLREKVVP
jgi:TATA-binding protein-associated factor Taf7